MIPASPNDTTNNKKNGKDEKTWRLIFSFMNLTEIPTMNYF